MALTQISTAGVKDDAVTAGKIPANAVGSSELADNAVDTAAIANDAVTNAKVADDAIGVAQLSASGTASSSTFLRGDNSWTTVNTDLVADTSPQLGGDLASNGNDIDFADNDKAVFGTGSDLRIFHNGSDSVLQDTGTGNLLFISNQVQIKNAANDETLAKFIENGAVELYYDNSKKFETFSWGIQNYGNVAFRDSDKASFGASEDLQIYHNGTNSIIDSNTGNLEITSDAFYVNNAANNEVQIKAVADGGVELYHNNLKRLQTESYGARVFGPSSGECRLEIQGSEGQGAYLQLNADDGDDNPDYSRFYHGTDGSLYIQNFTSGSWETYIKATGNGSVDLFHDNTKVFTTIADGVSINGFNGDATSHGTLTITGDSSQDSHQGILIAPGAANSQAHIRFGYGSTLKWQWRVPFHSDGAESKMQLYNWTTGDDVLKVAPNGDQDVRGTIFPRANNTYDLGTSGNRWRNIYTNDLNLSNEGSSNDMDGSWGDWTIQEGESDLFLKNNRSGKKFKFNLTEVS